MFKGEYPLPEYLGIVGYLVTSVIVGFYCLLAAPYW